MRKTLLLVFTIVLLAAAAFAPTAFAQGASNNGYPGNGDNCTGNMYGTGFAPDRQHACTIYC